MGLRFDLRRLIQDYEARTGLRLSYEQVAELAAISEDTIKSIATRPGYNATLHTIDSICAALGVSPIKYLSWKSDSVMDVSSQQRRFALPPNRTKGQRPSRNSS